MSDPTRRAFLELVTGTAGLLVLGACEDGDSDAPAEPHDTAEAPSICGAVTPASAEGPYYRAAAPHRTDLRTLGEAGTTLTFDAVVRSSAGCELLAGAIVELWHAEQTGVYDMDSADMHYRTQMRAGFDGSFGVITLVPPAYPVGDRMMPRHLHFRITAPHHHELVTQLRWKGDVQTDGFSETALMMSPTVAADGSEAVSWEFVLEHV